MPPLASVAIPVINLSQSSGSDRPSSSKGKAATRQTYNPRTYNNEPLPVRPSGEAPRNAKIVGRVLDPYGATYQLKIGEVEINDVGVNEILDYVSAIDLEEYENRQFEEEREVLNAVEAEKVRLRREKLERMKERAKRKGVVVFEDVDVANKESEGAEVETGRHGRARPTYTQFYLKTRMRGKMTRDLDSSNVLQVSQDDKASSASEDESAGPATAIRPQVPFVELSKRRRRKRDKVTGELLPLSPVKPKAAELDPKKRQRRKRHPVTNQLMPVGWRYDPDEDGDSHTIARGGLDSPSIKGLSISLEHDTKRQRLDTGSSMSRSSSPIPTKAQIAAQISAGYTQTPKKEGSTPKKKHSVIDLLTSADESEPDRTAPTTAKRLPNSFGKESGLSKHRMLQSALTSSTPESSPEPTAKTSLTQPTARTSIVNPTATRASSTDAPAQHLGSKDGDSEQDLDEDEWFIEAILAHSWSDPASHPEELGSEPVMLYQVKWDGHETPTWEPIGSFGDPGLVKAYRVKVGLDPAVDQEGVAYGEDVAIRLGGSANPLTLAGAAQHPHAQFTTVEEGAEDDESQEEEVGEGEYEVESILAHHLSDPRTHPPWLGITPVMLYQVKWNGWEKPSWEPAASFEDTRILTEYRGRVGLEHPHGDGGGDGNMAML